MLSTHDEAGQPIAEFNAFEAGNASDAAKAILTVSPRCDQKQFEHSELGSLLTGLTGCRQEPQLLPISSSRALNNGSTIETLSRFKEKFHVFTCESLA